MSLEEGLAKVVAACRALGLSRSSYYRSKRSSLESRRIRKEVLELSAKHPRYGYRRITALMRREGFEVNGKRVSRIRREEGIEVSKKQRRMKRLGISTAERQRAERPGQVWSWDVMADQTENGSRFRILTLLDEHTRNVWPFILRGRSEPSMRSGGELRINATKWQTNQNQNTNEPAELQL
jgi:putative transposase